jgi:uncharacterized cupin superfamily protein
MKKPDFIKNVEELVSKESFSYPGDTETFGTGAPIGRILGLENVAINYEILAPGDRSSWPHAHSAEEEFIFILEGTPDMWINGEIYPLKNGDCIGLPPGTNHAHTLLNNSNSMVKAIVVGQAHVETDKIYYPMHPKRNEEMKKKGHLWEERPVVEMSLHDGVPNLVRKA